LRDFCEIGVLKKALCISPLTFGSLFIIFCHHNKIAFGVARGAGRGEAEDGRNAECGQQTTGADSSGQAQLR